MIKERGGFALTGAVLLASASVAKRLCDELSYVPIVCMRYRGDQYLPVLLEVDTDNPVDDLEPSNQHLVLNKTIADAINALEWTS